MHSALTSPQGIWWKPAGSQENTWIKVSFVWCMIMFAIMPLWHWKGGQNPSGIRGRTTPQEFRQRTERFIQEYQVGTEKGIPVVQPPPGADLYLEASMWSWRPVLKLKKGASYTLHLSSFDINHGFSLYPMNLNFQVVPGYDYGLKVMPNRSGDLRIICNEFCGVGHHIMTGKILVEE
ncbi:MAG: cytochrome C oxidase subunit II [Candidatus Eremiobacteraeota bacterium]|nr:cytochrome C oxidase subunit II [Candidatus Eremiobacteraeota bacterium]